MIERAERSGAPAEIQFSTFRGSLPLQRPGWRANKEPSWRQQRTGKNLTAPPIITEGEDKPLKYPTIFNSADIAVVTKMDLANALEFDWEAAQRKIQAVRPGMQVLRVSAKTGEGMNGYMGVSSLSG